MPPSLAKRAAAEWLGSAFLLAAVVGSGIMAAKLSSGNAAIALLCNTIPTGAILAVLILMFAPVSGAHFNPAVSLAFALRGELRWPDACVYAVAQVAGAIAGAWAAHLMFELPVLQVSATVRSGTGQWFAEAIATFGLMLAIIGCRANAPASVPYAIGLYITSAYWFTASTSFANPAVTLARALTDTFSGIAPGGVPAFIAAQVFGAIIGVLVAGWMWREHPASTIWSSTSRLFRVMAMMFLLLLLAAAAVSTKFAIGLHLSRLQNFGCAEVILQTGLA